jgi:hypothetical protein
VLWDGTRLLELRRPAVAGTNDHGTGCSLASAIAAGLAKGDDLVDAVASAKAYVARALAGGATWRLGAGTGRSTTSAGRRERRRARAPAAVAGRGTRRATGVRPAGRPAGGGRAPDDLRAPAAHAGAAPAGRAAERRCDVAVRRLRPDDLGHRVAARPARRHDRRADGRPPGAAADDRLAGVAVHGDGVRRRPSAARRRRPARRARTAGRGRVGLVPRRSGRGGVRRARRAGARADGCAPARRCSACRPGRASSWRRATR